MNKRDKQRGADRFIVMGIEQQLRSMVSIHLVGKCFTPESLADLFQRRMSASTDVDVAHATWRSAVKERARLDREATQVAAALRTLVFALFGPRSVGAAAFGFEQRPRRTLSAAEKAAAARKRWSTILARRAGR